MEKGRKKIRTLLFLTIYFAFYNCDKQLQLILMFNELKISIVVGLTKTKKEATITYTNREQMI